MGSPQNPLAGPNYQQFAGPFTDVLTQPAWQYPQQNPYVLGHAGPAGAIAHIAENFLSGMQQGNLRKFQQEENKKAQNIATLRMLHDQVQNNPNLTDDYKAQVSTQYTQALLPQIASIGTKIPDDTHHGALAGAIVKMARNMSGGNMKPQAVAEMPAATMQTWISGIQNPANTWQGKQNDALNNLRTAIQSVHDKVAQATPGAEPSANDIHNDNAVKQAIWQFTASKGDPTVLPAQVGMYFPKAAQWDLQRLIEENTQGYLMRRQAQQQAGQPANTAAAAIGALTPTPTPPAATPAAAAPAAPPQAPGPIAATANGLLRAAGQPAVAAPQAMVGSPMLGAMQTPQTFTGMPGGAPGYQANPSTPVPMLTGGAAPASVIPQAPLVPAMLVPPTGPEPAMTIGGAEAPVAAVQPGTPPPPTANLGYPTTGGLALGPGYSATQPAPAAAPAVAQTSLAPVATMSPEDQAFENYVLNPAMYKVQHPGARIPTPIVDNQANGKTYTLYEDPYRPGTYYTGPHNNERWTGLDNNREGRYALLKPGEYHAQGSEGIKSLGRVTPAGHPLFFNSMELDEKGQPKVYEDTGHKVKPDASLILNDQRQQGMNDRQQAAFINDAKNKLLTGIHSFEMAKMLANQRLASGLINPADVPKEQAKIRLEAAQGIIQDFELNQGKYSGDPEWNRTVTAIFPKIWDTAYQMTIKSTFTRKTADTPLMDIPNYANSVRSVLGRNPTPDEIQEGMMNGQIRYYDWKSALGEINGLAAQAKAAAAAPAAAPATPTPPPGAPGGRREPTRR